MAWGRGHRAGGALVPRIIAAAAGLVVVAACDPAEEAIVDGEAAVDVDALPEAEQAAIYGSDDRRDYYESSDQVLRTRTRESIVALISPWSIDASNPNDVAFPGPTLGQSKALCAGERFADQPTAAFCSGTLIDDDLVLTAGHCVDPATTSCSAEVRVVFDYYYESPGQLAQVSTSDIYSCQDVVAFALGQSGSALLDFAIIKLDRPATGRVPAPVRAQSSSLGVGTAVGIIGMGSGIPAKLDNGGSVIDSRSGVLDYFVATTDSFAGNSGSGVFSGGGDVVGILVRGAKDYDDVGGCQVVTTYPSSGQGGGESVTYVHRAVDQLCASGYASARLCDTEAACGDGQCTSGETADSCPADCEAQCGNGRCESGEDATCPSDCGTGVPVGWSCDTSFFAAGDGCDCNCGAIDPDCADSSQQLYGCNPGEFCNSQGTCSNGQAGGSWICPASYFAAFDGCDCNCGELDPDCSDPSQTVYGCAAGEVCGPTGACEGSGPVWICSPAYYGASDGCDCNCGVRDPDCDDATQVVYGCPAGEMCNAAGACGSDVPAGWTCDPSYYANLDGCDCNCGVRDPDCDDGSQQVLGCATDVCLDDGTCEEDVACSHVDVSRGTTWPAFALALVPLCLARRRRVR